MKKISIEYYLVLLVLFLVSCERNAKSDNKLEAPEYAIAYNVLYDEDNDNYEVFTMNMDGTNKQNVTRLSGVEWTYHSYGNQLYFISDKDTCQRCAYYLYETNFNGAEPKKISEIRLADSWMSSRNNGSELIVTPHKSVDSVFYILDLSGKVLNKVSTGLRYAMDPSFSPDGTKIAFRGAVKKSKRETDFEDAIYTIKEDGTDRRKLTKYPKSDTTAQWYAYKAGPPQWHPIENFISYASFQNGKYSLYAVSPDGSKNWKLTNRPESEVYHSWSPDGKYLVMDLSDTLEKQFHIGLLDWKTKELKVLTDTTYQYQQAPNFVNKQPEVEMLP